MSPQNQRFLEGKGFVKSICFCRNGDEHGTHKCLLNKQTDEECWWSPEQGPLDPCSSGPSGIQVMPGDPAPAYTL